VLFCIFLENDKTDLRQFFQDLGENTCSMQPALKSGLLHPAFKVFWSESARESNSSLPITRLTL